MSGGFAKLEVRIGELRMSGVAVSGLGFRV